jgi:drug/metabolite transporter (DMT)-like permease
MLLVSRPVRTQDDNVKAGIAWMLITTFFFVSLDTVAKHLVSSYPVLQVVWGRFLFHMILAALILGPRFAMLARSANLPLQIVRSIFLLATTILFFSGVRLLPLADASAIMFTSPILLSILAIPLLGEKVGPYRWAAIFVAFLGALVVVRPGSGMMGAGALFLLGCAFCNAFYQLITRQLRGTDDARTTLLYTGLAGTVGTSLAVPLVWTPIALGDWPLFAALGVFGCLGHFTLIKAFQSAPATVVAPFSYASIIWAILFGFFVFDDLPDLWTLVGATIIAAGGLYILHREQVRKREKSGKTA